MLFQIMMMWGFMSSDVGLTYLCYFRQTTGIYRSMISEWRRQSKSAGL